MAALQYILLFDYLLFELSIGERSIGDCYRTIDDYCIDLLGVLNKTELS